jgi:hypothetical protein
LQPGSNWAMDYLANGLLAKCKKTELRLCGGYAIDSGAGANDAHSPVDSRNDGDAQRATLVTACANPIKIQRSGYRLNRATNRYAQTITLKNDSAQAAAGPITYLLFNLSANATLFGGNRTVVIIPAGTASFIFTISVDTSALIGHPAGPFYIEFQLNDGSGTGNGNNTALLGTFDFAGGAPVGSPILIGGASGDLSSHVVLSDDDFLNEFIQQFTPGPLLTFAVELSTVVELGPQPDQFSFAILDCNLFEIPTMGPADALVIADITSQPVARAFASDLSARRAAEAVRSR